MGAVQAENVRAGFDHLRDHLLAPGGRTQRGDHLRLTLAVIHLPRLVGFIHDGAVLDLRLEEVADGLRFQRSICLGHDRLARKLAACSFSAQHDGVAAVEHSILQVAHLGPGWHRVLNHALHHLRCVNHKQARLLGPGNEQLLRERHALELQLDAQIPPGDHQGL